MAAVRAELTTTQAALAEFEARLARTRSSLEAAQARIAELDPDPEFEPSGSGESYDETSSEDGDN